jgi:hypothetical protein
MGVGRVRGVFLLVDEVLWFGRSPQRGLVGVHSVVWSESTEWGRVYAGMCVWQHCGAVRAFELATVGRVQLQLCVR